MTIPAALPWLHPTVADLAKAIGVTTRTLEQWRGKGCPLGDKAPFDELAVRLWHLGLAAIAKGKAAELAQPRAELAPYVDQAARAVEQLRADLAGGPDRSDIIKERQAERLELLNAGTRKQFVTEAQETFRAYAGSLERALTRALAGKTLTRLWDTCQKPRLQAEGAAQRLLRETVATAMAKALAEQAKG